MRGVEIFEGNWSTDLVNSNPQKIYIFGDNDQRVGRGGQAVIRGLDNVIGIRTKKSPSISPRSYYNDNEYDANCQKILEDVILIKSKLLEGNRIVLSKNGYGTGLASLEEKAPKTFSYLCDCLRIFFEFDNKTGQRWQIIPPTEDFENGEYIKFTKQNTNLFLPTNNSEFLDSLLNVNILNHFDAVRLQKRISITTKSEYKKDQILLLSFPNHKDYAVVKVLIDSFEIIDLNLWSKFEGVNPPRKPRFSGYKQTLFSFVCQLSENGEMIFNI
jgi:hypothetical protein